MKAMLIKSAAEQEQISYKDIIRRKIWTWSLRGGELTALYLLLSACSPQTEMPTPILPADGGNKVVVGTVEPLVATPTQVSTDVFPGASATPENTIEIHSPFSNEQLDKMFPADHLGNQSWTFDEAGNLRARPKDYSGKWGTSNTGSWPIVFGYDAVNGYSVQWTDEQKPISVKESDFSSRELPGVDHENLMMANGPAGSLFYMPEWGMFASPLNLESHTGGIKNYQFVTEDDFASGRFARSILLNADQFAASPTKAKIYLDPTTNMRWVTGLSIYPQAYDIYNPADHVGGAYRAMGPFLVGTYDGPEVQILIPIQINTDKGIVVWPIVFGDEWLNDQAVGSNGLTTLEEFATNRPTMKALDVVVATRGIAPSDIVGPDNPYQQHSADRWIGGVGTDRGWDLMPGLVPADYWNKLDIYGAVINSGATGDSLQAAAETVKVEVDPAKLAGLSRLKLLGSFGNPEDDTLRQ